MKIDYSRKVLVTKESFRANMTIAFGISDVEVKEGESFEQARDRVIREVDKVVLDKIMSYQFGAESASNRLRQRKEKEMRETVIEQYGLNISYDDQ